MLLYSVIQASLGRTLRALRSMPNLDDIFLAT